jgi:Protein of unknown function (DUF2934)
MSTRMSNSEVMFTEFHSQLTNIQIPAPNEVREMIARRAYKLYENRGDKFGDEISDWLQAEDEVVTMLLSLPIDSGKPESYEGARPGRTASPRSKKSFKATRTSPGNGNSRKGAKRG